MYSDSLSSLEPYEEEQSIGALIQYNLNVDYQTNVI